MKCIILALALVGAVSAALISPFARGYSNYGWGHTGLAVPTVTSYNAPFVSSVIDTPLVATVAPALAAHHHSLTGNLLTGHTFGAPALTSHTLTAPLVSAYHAGSTVIGTPTVLGHGGYLHGDLIQGGLITDNLGYYNGWDIELLKKKKKAAH